MRRTLISAKGFTAPRSSTATTTAELPNATQGKKSASRDGSKRGTSANTSLGGHVAANPRLSTSHTHKDERRSTTGAKGGTTSRKRPRGSRSEAISSQGSNVLDGASGSVNSSLSTALETSQTESRRSTTAPQKKSRSEKTARHVASEKRGRHGDISDDEDDDEHDDDAITRSRRLHNGDIIALAPPPPKNLTHPSAPRGLHHPSGQGARRQVIYPDPVIPSVSALYYQDGASGVVTGTEVAFAAAPAPLPPSDATRTVANEPVFPVPPTWSAHMLEAAAPLPPPLPSPQLYATTPNSNHNNSATPLRVVVYPANGAARQPAVPEDASPEAIPPPPPPQFAFADAIASAASSLPSPGDAVAVGPSHAWQPPSPLSTQISPHRQTATAPSSGEGTSPSPSSSLSTAASVGTAVAVHQRSFLQAMMEMANAAATPPHYAPPSPMCAPADEQHTGDSCGVAPLPPSSSSPFSSSGPQTVLPVTAPSSASSASTPALSDVTARALLWEPAAAVSCPASGPRRRTMVTFAKPTSTAAATTAATEQTIMTKTPPEMCTDAVAGTSVELPPSPPLMAATEDRPCCEPAPATAPATESSVAMREGSMESAELFPDREDDSERPRGSGEDGVAAPEVVPNEEEHASDGVDGDPQPQADKDAANDALDREVEEDLRLSEDLPFTPSGFYTSSPFAAQRLTQDDDGDAAAGEFQEELLAKMDLPTASAVEQEEQLNVVAEEKEGEGMRDAVPVAVVAADTMTTTAPPSNSPVDPIAEDASPAVATAVADPPPSETLVAGLHPLPLPEVPSPKSVVSGTRTLFRFTTASAATAATEVAAPPPLPPSPPLVHSDSVSLHAPPVNEPTPVDEEAPPAGENARAQPPQPSLGRDSDSNSRPPKPAEDEENSNGGPGEAGTTSSGRPRRTLFSFGVAAPPPPPPPPVLPSALPSAAVGSASSSPMRPAVLPDAAVAAGTSRGPSLAPHARLTPSPARPAMGVISAEPTEMFTDGDSMSVPLPLPPPAQPLLPPPSPLLPTEEDSTTTDPCYGLPPPAFNLFMRQRRIQKFYDWQHEVLTSADLLRGRNYVYSLPTSGGKTLVAEVSLLRCLLNDGKSCFFVLPFVSLAEEKTAALQPLGDAFGFRVEGHYGFTGRFPLPTDPTVYVCTIEKANSVLSYLLEEQRAVAELGLVVVDELHMLGESRRGATLEVFLSKLLLLRKRQEAAAAAALAAESSIESHRAPAPRPARVQLVGMSATVPNLPAIAQWLDAACYEGTYRPVPLHQYSVIDGMVLRDGEHNERNLSGRNEVEQLLELATELVDCSVLVFCASRQQCVDTAKGIVRYMQQTTLLRTAAEAMEHGTGVAAHSPPLSRAAALGAQPPQTAAALQALLNELMSLSYGQADQLGDLVPYGVAYHHGGLLAEERELIETAYRDRHLRILCCTSTLAAGVNLPARRVIFKSPYTGREFLTKSRYLQMCGRAGRAGMDTYGESFLVLNRRDRQRGLRLMRDPLEPCESQLLEDHGQFVRSLLECISVGLVTSCPHGLREWGGALFCGHALGALDVLTTADLWRQHRQLWDPTQPPLTTTAAAALPVLTACEEEAPTMTTNKMPAGSGIHPLPPGVLPPPKTPLTVTETRALRLAFLAQPHALLHTLLEAALRELLTHGFVELTERSAENDTLKTLTASADLHICVDKTADTDTASATTTTWYAVAATPFGVSSVRSCFSVESALLVRRELDEMLHMGLILADDLHLCYFLTPLREIPEDCDWVLYRAILSRLSDSRQRIASLIGLDEFYIDQRAMGLAGPKSHVATTDEARRQSFTARRFWVALILADVLAEVPMADVVERYGVNRGMLQDVMRSASMFSSSITSFCHAMGWYSLEAVLASFVKRLGFGVKPDIVPLMDIRGVQPSRARALWNAGYKDPARVAAADPDEMVTRVKASNPPDSKCSKFFTKRSALMVIREASLLIENQIREKRGELKELTARTAL